MHGVFVRQAVTAAILPLGPNRSGILAFYQTCERLPGVWVFRGAKKGAPSQSAVTGDVRDRDTSGARTTLIASFTIPDSLPPANIQPGIARSNLRDQPIEIPWYGNHSGWQNDLIIVQPVNDLYLGYIFIWFSLPGFGLFILVRLVWADDKLDLNAVVQHANQHA